MWYQAHVTNDNCKITYKRTLNKIASSQKIAIFADLSNRNNDESESNLRTLS